LQGQAGGWDGQAAGCDAQTGVADRVLGGGATEARKQ
jgi:hypothetical protein